MKVHLEVRNESARRGVYRSDNLRRIAERVCEGEGVGGEVELSLLLCDDPFIRELNREYRRKDAPTDVLSFAQAAGTVPGVRVLGDIVISLETVERFCGGRLQAMRDEVRLLFCHGLLHLLGQDHADAAGQARMQEKQAWYLGLEDNAAWRVR